MARKSRRRKKSSSHNLPTIVGSVIAVALIGGGFLFIKNKNTPKKSPVLPIERYVVAANSYRGNTYQVSGEVFEIARHDPSIGKQVFVSVDTGDDPYPADLPKDIGILIPTEVKGPNIETKQSYEFIVEVKDRGTLIAQSYTAK